MKEKQLLDKVENLIHRLSNCQIKRDEAEKALVKIIDEYKQGKLF